jgi:uncharacterized protein YbbK (DUF523 family)
MILVSGCLLGVNCKYNGGNNKSEKLLEILDKYGFVPVCPEQLGGMTTPRKPSEISKDGKIVVDTEGQENTEFFLKGAEETLKIAKIFKAKYAILKERSPSCGSSFIYDGTFSGKLIPGKGFTAALLEENGIKVYSEEEIDQFIEDMEQLIINN